MFYKFVRALARAVFLLLGLKSEGIHKLPDKGPVIVAANHVSNWDAIMVAISLPRPVHFIAKAELFENRFLARLVKALHAFPVKRGAADRRALRYALGVLEKGEVLGIFPEGERIRMGQEGSTQTGVAMLALKSGAPVVPVACIGTERFFPVGWFTPLKVKVGKPLILGEYHDQKVTSAILEEVSTIIMREIESLLSK